MNDTLQFLGTLGSENSDAQTFWNTILRDFLGIERPEEYIQFQKRVYLGHISYIDAYIPSTGIVIEHKSSDIDLNVPAQQSDGTSLTPYGQAKRYYDNLPMIERGKFIITCNFKEIRVYDMNSKNLQKPNVVIIPIDEITPEKLEFLVNKEKPILPEEKISREAGTLVRSLYFSLLARYDEKDKEDKNLMKGILASLNVFCVRIVFLLYAEDSGLFTKAQFHDYLKPRAMMARDALLKLFHVLKQKKHEREKYLEQALADFPYVNGGLFEKTDIELPQLDDASLRIILEDMSEHFDWKGINPTIFGAIFESTLNPETRKEGGMHYTSIENIHRVIDPLFMNELAEEAKALLENSPTKKKLEAFQEKLASLTFFDPACGSGNFLTESYMSLRRLENKIINALAHGQKSFAFSKEETPIRVHLEQFRGIEINDFAVAVAKTALWIAESQMWTETAEIVKLEAEFLPLKHESGIKLGDALKIDWTESFPEKGNVYIMSNPPFLGYSEQTKAQKDAMKDIFGDIFGNGKVDYVAGWYWKAGGILADKRILAAFVSTNSIVQGEQVAYVFKPLRDEFDVHVEFAHTTFVWNSEVVAEEMAHVHCCVVGLAGGKRPGPKRLYINQKEHLAEKLNYYLLEGDEIFAESRADTLCENVPKMSGGNAPLDGGHLLIEADEYDDFIAREPKAKKFIKRFMMGNEFINNIPRWCLWLVDATPQELQEMPLVMERLKAVKEFRLSSKRKATHDKANTPYMFGEIVYKGGDYIAIPKTSSEKREYIPMGWLGQDVIPGDGLRIIPDATLYDFGVLTSRVHMAWMRVVCGRLKSDYRYSARVVYNNFVWPEPSAKQRAKIEETAQGILDARGKFPESSFAALYSPLTMPAELRKAHERNDAAVLGAYGWKRDTVESEIVSRLFRMYDAIANGGERR